MSGRVNQNSLKICIIKRLTTYIVGKRTHWTAIFSFNGNEYGKTLKTENHIIDIMWFLHSEKENIRIQEQKRTERPEFLQRTGRRGKRI